MGRADRPKTMAVAPSWIEAHCVIPDGFRKGEPFRLYNYQLRFFANFYLVRPDAFWNPDAPLLAPAFVYRRGMLVGPQKLGKGPHTASHVCLEGVGPALFAGWASAGDGYACADWGCGCGWEYEYDAGEPMGMPWPTPLIQITAFSEEQTENVYDALRPMIEQGPLSDVIPKTGEEFIRLPGGGRIDTVTSSAQSRLGQRVTFVPQDEVGIWTPTNRMTKVADTQYRGLAGMGGRASLTTNAWDPSEDSVAQQQFESPAKDIYRQMDVPPAGLDFAKPDERKTILRAVYPPDVLREAGGHIDLEAIEAEAADLAERDAPQAARFFGNQTVKGTAKAVDPAVWDELVDLEPVERGTAIAIGFDGSETDDHTVMVGTVWGTNHQFVLGHWDPAEYPSDVWRLAVHERLAEVMSEFRVGRMLCDPSKWRTDIATWQRKYGEKVVLEYPQNDFRMGPATEAWLEAIRNRQLTHDGHAAFRAHVVAASRKPSERKVHGRHWPVLTKGDDRRKIDLAVAAVMSLEAVAHMPEPSRGPLRPFISVT